MKLATCLLGGAVCCVLFSQGVAAAPLPDSSTIVDAFVGYNQEERLVTTGAASASYSNAHGYAYADVVVSPQAVTTATVSGSGIWNVGFGPTAGAVTRYSLELTGPSSIAVPVQIHSVFTSSFSLATDFYFQVDMYVGPHGYLIGGENGHPSFAYDTAAVFQSNTVIPVELFDYVAYEYTGAENSFAATLTIDPIITIDPAFLAANPGYSLTLSTGVGNGGAAPEPASWALMLVGLGGVGFGLRRRSRAYRRRAAAV